MNNSIGPRLKYIEVSLQVVTEICKKAIANKIPKDSRVIRASINTLTNNFDIVIESKEFDPVPEGAKPLKIKKSPVISSDMLK